MKIFYSIVVNRLVLILLNLLSNYDSFSQFTQDDISIKVENFNTETSDKFKAQLPRFHEILNTYKISESIKPLALTVRFGENGGSFIRASFDFSPEQIYSEGKYKQHKHRLDSYGSGGVSVLIIDELFNAISEYKWLVARNGYSIDSRIIQITNVVMLNGKNDEKVLFYSENKLNSSGFIPFTFYNEATFKKGDNISAINGANVNALKHMKFFWPKRSLGKDDSAAAAFLSFFE